MKNKSVAFFDRVSSKASKAPKELGETARKTVECARAYLSREKAVLDFGCGAGDLTIAIAQNAKSVRAIDTSPGMLEVARARSGARGIENVEFAKEDLHDVDHRRGSIDVVTAFNVLHYVEDTQGTCRRINELLSPGRLFISATACLGEKRTLLGTLALILTKLKVMPNMRFYKESELETMIASGGFRIVETRRLSKLPDYFIVAEKIGKIDRCDSMEAP
jgi:2-polyprenyl-3-methyl-5-hydroxy-6-metoxy-1,4-benzoquinol methylase